MNLGLPVRRWGSHCEHGIERKSFGLWKDVHLTWLKSFSRCKSLVSVHMTCICGAEISVVTRDWPGWFWNLERLNFVGDLSERAYWNNTGGRSTSGQETPFKYFEGRWNILFLQNREYSLPSPDWWVQSVWTRMFGIDTFAFAWICVPFRPCWTRWSTMSGIMSVTCFVISELV